MGARWGRRRLGRHAAAAAHSHACCTCRACRLAFDVLIPRVVPLRTALKDFLQLH